MSAKLQARNTSLCFAALAALLLLSVSGCATSPKNVFPGANWEHNQAGLPPEVVREVGVFVRTLDTTGLLVVKGGKVIYEYGNVTEPVYLASARKSVLSMLYGPYVANGTIRLDRTLKDLGLSDVGGLLPIEERATVMDLITARSGVYHPASNDGDLLEFAPKRGSQEPGSYWLYSNWDFNAAGAAFERMTGKNIYDALRDNLAVPIGMQDFNREQQKKDDNPGRSQYPPYPMWLSTRDMARLGYLMLREGQWQDRQLIPAEWVKRSTRAVTPVSEMHPDTLRSEPFGYGCLGRFICFGSLPRRLHCLGCSRPMDQCPPRAGHGRRPRGLLVIRRPASQRGQAGLLSPCSICSQDSSRRPKRNCANGRQPQLRVRSPAGFANLLPLI